MPRPRRGWRPLLWAVAAFAGLQLAVAALLDLGPVALRDWPFAEKLALLRARISAEPGRPLVLALGSSRVLFALKPGEVRDTLGADGPVLFNFGMAGAGPLRQHIYYNRVRAAGVRPDFVLLEVLPPLFNRASGPNQEENWFQGEWLSLGELRDIESYHSTPSRLVRRWAQARIAPWMFHADGLRRAGGLEHGPDPLGPLGADGWLITGEQFLNAKELRQRAEVTHHLYARTFGPYSPAPEPARALERLVREMRDDGVAVTLVMMPEGKAFRDWYPPGMIDGLRAWLTGLCEGERVKLVDARTWVEDDHFRDAHHMLPRGAKAFSRELARSVVRPLVD